MMFGIDSLYIWLAVIIISVAVEAFTLTLCGIWFAAGGVAALIAASLSVGLMGQWIVFIVFSGCRENGGRADAPVQAAVRLTRKLQSGQESRLWRSAASRRL